MTSLKDMSCFMQGASGGGIVLDLERVVLATGRSCAIGSWFQVACALGCEAMQVPRRPGADSWPRFL